MKYESAERKKEILSLLVKKNQSFICYVPVFYTLSIMVFTLISLTASLLNYSFISLSELPLMEPSIFQLGIFLGSIPGFVLVWAYNMLLWSKLKESNLYIQIFVCFLAGIASQTSLLLFGAVPIEQTLISTPMLSNQENLFLAAFLISSLVYETFSLFLTIKMNQKNIAEPCSYIIGIKTCLLVLVYLGSIGSLLLVLYLNVKNSGQGLENIIKGLNYGIFFLHVLYSGSFYWDFAPMTIVVSFGADDSEEQLVSSSSF